MEKTKHKFIHAETKETGRPPHNPVRMFKLYIYCYYEKIRSSRKIEAECNRNMELIWLMEGVTPDHKCIAEFRRQNKAAIKEAFSEFIEICDSLGLIGKDLTAIDGSKFRANNARKKNITIGKINKKLEYFHRLLEEHNRELEKNDSKTDKVKTKINELNDLKESIEEQGVKEISLTDPDSRLMGTANAGYEVSYNVQTSVDSKCDLVVVTDVINNAADQGQLYRMAKQTAEVFGATEEKPLTALGDKGYFEGEDIQSCEDDPLINAIVAKSEEQGNDGYQKSKFIYDAEKDQYTCPQKQILHRIGQKKRDYINKRACRECKFREQCTKNKSGRTITRSQYEEAIESAVKRFSENKELYKKRQMIVEHPFGTIKRGLGFTYFLTRGIENVRTENRMHMLTYNIKRVLNIFSVPDLTCKLKEIRGKMQGNQGDNSVVILTLLHLLPMFKLYKGNPAKFANI
jgi:transposase